MSYFVRYRESDFTLGDERFVVGRAEACGLSIDDPLASRTHAAFFVDGARVLVEDLGSRNGVRVNGEKIIGTRELVHGDIVRIGSQEMTLMKRRSARADTLVQPPVTQRLKAFGVLGSLAEKALALGHGEEAERIIGRQLDVLVEDAEQRKPLDDATFVKAAHYAVRLATVTNRGRWVDYLFRLHAAQNRLMVTELVDQLYELARKVSGASPAQLRAYLEVLKSSAAAPGGVPLGPSERFLIGRIEGLSALLR
jgi:hypothetical protein